MPELLGLLISGHNSKVVGILELLSIAFVAVLEQLDNSLSVPGILLILLCLAVLALEAPFLGMDFLSKLPILVLDSPDVPWQCWGGFPFATEAVGGPGGLVRLGSGVGGLPVAMMAAGRLRDPAWALACWQQIKTSLSVAV